MLSDEKLKYALALSRISGVGDVIAKTLISYCSGVENIFSKKKSQLLKVPGIGPILADAICNYKDFTIQEKEIEFIRKHRIQTVFYTDENYPLGLKQVSDSPILLFQKGELNLNEGRFISLVGTRNATDYGKEWTTKFIEEIAAYHPIIVSGLAFGIDIAAHRAALKYGLKTIAVLGHPLNTIYPGQHRSAAEKIIEQHLQDFKQILKQRRVELAMRQVPERIKEIKETAMNSVFAADIQNLEKAKES